jgi:acyl-CoA synthetase (AMP-forming)/AMP-acid ligase II
VEIENVIAQLDSVLENAVIGVPHSKWGEVGRAFVVLKPGSHLNATSILSHCRDRLARYKIPQEIRLLDGLPHNGTGKVAKRELPRD